MLVVQGGSVGIYAAGRDGCCSNADIILYPNFNFPTLINSCPYLRKLPWNIPNSVLLPSRTEMQAYQTVGMPRYGLVQFNNRSDQCAERVCMGWFTGGNPNQGSCQCGNSSCYTCMIHAGCGGGGGAAGGTNGCGGAGIAFVEYVSVG